MGVLPLILVLAAVGCASEPTDQIAAARAAVESAKSAEAASYAVEEFNGAEQAVAELDAELALQAEKFALFRSYDKATELAGKAKSAGESAATAAASGKERARDQAMADIASAKALLGEVQTLLTTAPTGKGAQADLAMLRADLAGVESALADVDRAFEAGQYLDAGTGAVAARTNAEKVRTAIMDAVQARSAAKRIRG